MTHNGGLTTFQTRMVWSLLARLHGFVDTVETYPVKADVGDIVNHDQPSILIARQTELFVHSRSFGIANIASVDVGE